MKPGMVMSSELHARAPMRDGVGGEHRAWWMKRTRSPAVEVAATLAAMAVRGIGGVVLIID